MFNMNGQESHQIRYKQYTCKVGMFLKFLLPFCHVSFIKRSLSSLHPLDMTIFAKHNTNKKINLS